MILRLLITPLLLAQAASAQQPAQDAPTDDAVAAIALPEPQLRKMLATVLVGTQTMAMSNYALGVKGACSVLKPAFEEAVAQTLPQWRANLIKAYRDNVPTPVLSQASSGSLLASAMVLQPYMGQIGASMQRDSEPLLKKAGEGPLLAILTEAAKVDMKKVDGPTRMTEMKQAQADGTLFCGLVPTGAAR